MKTTLTIFLLFLVELFALPQDNNLQIISRYAYGYSSISDSDLFFREERTYDDRGNLSQMTTYTLYTPDKKWIGSIKDEYKWDDNRNNTLHIHYVWNWDLDTWRENAKNENAFDAANRLTSEARYYWNTDTKIWVCRSKNEYSWNSAGKKTLELTYYGSDVTNSWVPDWKTEYAYDAQNREISSLTTRWTGGDYLDIYYKTENIYDTGGKLTRSVSYDWDAGNSSWVIFSTTDNTYDANGKQTSAVRFENPTPIHLEMGTYKYEYSYDLYGNVILWIYCKWNPAKSDWDKQFKNEYAFTWRGDMTLSSSYSWDTTAVDWNMQSQYNYSYDQNGKRLGSDWEYWGLAGQNTYYRGKMDYIYSADGTLINVSLYTGNSQSGPLILNSKTYYSFSPFAVVYPATDITIFPNPFTDFLYIGVPDESQYNSLEVYDLNGKLVARTTTRTADLSLLKQGVYSVRILDKDGRVIRSSKVVKL